jgi:hypothetical protein
MILFDDRIRTLRGKGPELLGTTRIAALVKRYEDEVTCARREAFTTGPVEQRRD